MRGFLSAIVAGVLLLLAGVVIALPADDLRTILIGAALCWMALPCFWLASKVQPR